MSKGVRFRTTIANLTERSETAPRSGEGIAGAQRPQTKAPLVQQGELREAVRGLLARSAHKLRLPLFNKGSSAKR